MILSDKRKVRQAVRAEIAKLPTEERTTLSSQIFSKIAELKEFGQASVIALFMALPDEPQTAAFIAQISRYKRVVVPRIEGEEMEFYDIAEGVEGLRVPVPARFYITFDRRGYVRVPQ